MTYKNNEVMDKGEKAVARRFSITTCSAREENFGSIQQFLRSFES